MITLTFEEPPQDAIYDRPAQTKADRPSCASVPPDASEEPPRHPLSPREREKVFDAVAHIIAGSGGMLPDDRIRELHDTLSECLAQGPPPPREGCA